MFQHKWLLLAFVCLGLAGAAAGWLVRPPVDFSKAKVMVNFVVNDKQVTRATPDNPHAQVIDAGAQSILNAEVEILTSLDVAVRVAETIGPAKILAQKGGRSDLMAAAGVIYSGIEVDPPKSPILNISFKHPDRDLVQPVIEAVLQAYMLKHRDVRLMPDDYLVQQREELRQKLGEIEDKLKSLKMLSKMPFPEEANRSFQRQIAKIQDDLLDAQRELLERKAVLGDQASDASGQTNVVEASIPAEQLTSYSLATTMLEGLKREQSDLLIKYTEAHPLVQNARGRIDRLTQQNSDR